MKEGSEMIFKFQNEHLQAQVKKNKLMLPFFSFFLIPALFFLLLSCFNTYKDLYLSPPLHQEEVAFDRNKVYRIEMTELPEKMSGKYYMVKSGEDAILVSSIYEYDIVDKLEKTGSVKVWGKMKNVPDNDAAVNAAMRYYEKHDYYNTKTRDLYSHIYFDCSKIRFIDHLLDAHPISLSFGLTFLIVTSLLVHWEHPLNLIKHLRPACGSVRYTQEEIDEQANLPESEWFDGAEMYFTPKIIIGTNKGMTAVEYEDIKKAYVNRKWHTEKKGTGKRKKYTEYYTYQVIVITYNHKRLEMCDSRHINIDAIKKKIDECCGEGIWVDKLKNNT